MSVSERRGASPRDPPPPPHLRELPESPRPALSSSWKGSPLPRPCPAGLRYPELPLHPFQRGPCLVATPGCGPGPTSPPLPHPGPSPLLLPCLWRHPLPPGSHAASAVALSSQAHQDSGPLLRCWLPSTCIPSSALLLTQHRGTPGFSQLQTHSGSSQPPASHASRLPRTHPSSPPKPQS